MSQGDWGPESPYKFPSNITTLSHKHWLPCDFSGLGIQEHLGWEPLTRIFREVQRRCQRGYREAPGRTESSPGYQPATGSLWWRLEFLGLMSGGLQHNRCCNIYSYNKVIETDILCCCCCCFNLSLKVTPYQSCCRSCVRSESQGVAHTEGNDFRGGLKYHEVRFTVDFSVCRENYVWF